MSSSDVYSELSSYSTDQLLAELKNREGVLEAVDTATSSAGAHGLGTIPSEVLYFEVRARQKVIYGVDDREDLFAVTDPAILRDADAVVALVRPNQLTDNGNGTSTLATVNYGASNNLCATEPFRAQPTAPFCSGFLVGPDIVATAGHCVDAGSLANTRFVFGFHMQNGATATTTFNNSEIYSGSALIGRVLNGSDWALVRLDRAVTNHAPAPVRRNGRIANNQAVHVIGHPSGLPLKFAGGANVRDNSPADHFVANLDTYGGNSGSPVFNSWDHKVEGILVRGETDFVMNGACFVSNICPGTGCRGEDVTRTTEFATLLTADRAVNGAPALIQSSFGVQGNFELGVAGRDRGLLHFWRENDQGSMPWHGPTVFGGNTRYDGVTMIQSNFGPGNLEVLSRAGSDLHFFWRTTGPDWAWSDAIPVAGGIAGNPALIQSSFGAQGNFELIAPMAGGGIGHFWRNNDDPTFPWFGPFIFGQGNTYDAVTMIQSNFGPGNLEVVARTGARLDFFWRTGGPDFRWSDPIPFAEDADGVPSLIQSSFGAQGNFELVVPRRGGGLQHFWRDNDASPRFPWHPGPLLDPGTRYQAATLIQSTYGPGNLELIAVTGDRMRFFWRTTGPAFAWSNPFDLN